MDTLDGVLTAEWNDFVGQTKAKEILKIGAKAAKALNAPLGHVILTSPAGLGKTTLALLCAKEMNSNLKIVSGKLGLKDIRPVLEDMEDNDILLLEEIHTLFQGGKSTADQWLLHLMENNTIIGKNGPEKVARITVIGTTTDLGLIPDATVSRFIYTPTLEKYSDLEATEIALNMGWVLFGEANLPGPTYDVAELIAAAAVNNPRTIKRIIIAVRNIELAENLDSKGNYDISRALELLGLAKDGIPAIGLQYLQTLAKDFPDGAGAATIADCLEASGGLLAVERILLQKGLIKKLKTGRTLTMAGRNRLQEG